MEDVEIAKEDPDPRGWDVIGSDGHKLGEVKDLLVDTASMKVRSLEVELEGSTFNWDDNRRVALPAEGVRLDEDRDKVVLEGLRYDEVGRMEPFAYPTSRTGSVGGPDTASPGVYGDRFEGTGRRLTRSEEELEIGTRERQAEVEIGKHVETEHVSEPVTRRRDRVYIERRPASGDTPRGATFQDDQVRVPVTEEEVVVEKRPVVKEELVVGKETVEDTSTIETDVRKERFDIKDDAGVLDESERRRKGGI